MAFRHGRKTGIAFQGTDLSSYLNEATATHNLETAETTAFSQDSKTYILGHRDGTVSLSGMFDGATDAIDEVINTAVGTEDGAHIIVQQDYGSGAAPGVRVNFCKGELTSYETSSPLADVTSVSIEVNADDGIYGGVALTGVDSDSLGDVVSGGSNVDKASIDNSASSSTGYVAQLQVVANTLDGNLVVVVEDSTDDAVWATLDTFTTVSSGTTTAEQVSGTGTVNRYVRVNLDASAATTGSATILVAFTRLPTT